MTEREEITFLRKKVRDLEKQLSVQAKLIEILKSMPGCQSVEVKDDGTENEKEGLPDNAQKPSRSVAKKSPKGKSKNSSSSA
jgi:hypothetical protein